MNKSIARLLVLVLFIATLPIFFITIPALIIIYNGIIKKNNQVKLGFSSVDVMLKKRSDLIPNLVASVREIMKHESGLIERVTALRSNILEQTDDAPKKFALENEMSGLIGQVTVAMESYPEIKSDKSIMHLQRSLNESEEQISAARRTYNIAATDYNDKIQAIPVNIVAAMAGFTEATLFEALEAERKNPEVGKLFS